MRRLRSSFETSLSTLQSEACRCEPRPRLNSRQERTYDFREALVKRELALGTNVDDAPVRSAIASSRVLCSASDRAGAEDFGPARFRCSASRKGATAPALCGVHFGAQPVVPFAMNVQVHAAAESLGKHTLRLLLNAIRLTVK